MIFWLIITILIIIALSIILVPYWRKTSVSTIDNADLNIMLYKRRLSELENDLNNDVLDKEQHEVALSELKLQLLSDVPEDQENETGSENNKRQIRIHQWSKQTIITAIVLIPALSIGLYIKLGNKDIATGNIEAATKQVAPDVEQMVAGLEKRLESQPNNVQGWLMLGKSYVAMNQYDKALPAYEKAYALAPEDADVLTYFAETLAILHDNQLQGRPLKLITRALEINKTHPRALWLAGHAQLQLGNRDKAINYWQTLLSTLPPGDESAQTVRKFIAQTGGRTDSMANEQAGRNNSATLNTNTQGIRVKVRLADKFKSTVPNNATVFVFARAVKGPKIPLAGVRLSFGDLPAELVLSDNNAMMPGRTISGVDQVIIGARISKSGEPVSKPGDLEGYSPVVSSAHPEILEITINQIAK